VNTAGVQHEVTIEEEKSSTDNKGKYCCSCGADASCSEGCYEKVEEKEKKERMHTINFNFSNEDGSYDKDGEDHEEMKADVERIRMYLKTLCCFCCRTVVSDSKHVCLHTGKKAMSWYFYESTDFEDEIPSAFL
jgi:hypothetical protein